MATESRRFHRRPPGRVWLVAVVTLPLLLAALGWGIGNQYDGGPALTPPSVPPSATLGATTKAGPPPPPAKLSPFSIRRTATGYDVGGQVPDAALKDSLLQAIGLAMPGAAVGDQLTVAPGSGTPDVAGLGGVFGVAAEIPDFALVLDGGVLTLTGSASSQQLKDDAGQAASATWRGARLVNQIRLTGATAPAAPGGCATLAADLAPTLATPITFATGSFVLDPGARRVIAAVADRVKPCPNARITVTGRTDGAGADAVNGPLSASRAQAVADLLVSDGVPAAAVTARGAGSAGGVGDDGTEDGRARNRRVEITVS